MSKKIRQILKTVGEEDSIIIHAHVDPGGDYDTLCGLDLDDPEIGHYSKPATRSDLINCQGCKDIFKRLRKYKITDFDWHT